MGRGDLQQLFYEPYNTYINPQIFRFSSLQALLERIPDLSYKRGLFVIKKN